MSWLDRLTIAATIVLALPAIVVALAVMTAR